MTRVSSLSSAPARVLEPLGQGGDDQGAVGQALGAGNVHRRLGAAGRSRVRS